jgi:hypothetical protein
MRSATLLRNDSGRGLSGFDGPGQAVNKQLNADVRMNIIPTAD